MPSDLAPFFYPKSVAVVGAGERPTSSGGAVCQNLRISGYAGRIIPVNPKGGSVFGNPARASLGELEAPADLCVIVIRPDLIPRAVEEAAASGHRNLLILPGGFAEAGAEGAARDAELRRLAEAVGITIAGPNCAGLIHLTDDSRFGATFLRDMPPGGGLAFISQSGALAEEVIAYANDHAVPIGTVVSVGNAMHLGVEDYLDYLGAEDRCTCCLLYVESIEDPARFREVCRRVAAKKPVVLLMGGRTAPGGKAAQAHTGAVVNGEDAIAAFAEDCCAVRVTSLRRLMLAAKGFGFHPQGLGGRVLVLSNSGGPGVLCTDRAALEGFALPALPPAMAQAMAADLPGEASIANPIDLLADAREERFGATLDLAIDHGPGTFDAILMIHVVPFMVDADPVIATMAEKVGRSPLPVFHAMMGTLPDKAAWFARMEEAGVPMFNDVEAMAECAGLLRRYPPLRARAAEPATGKPALKGRG